MKFQNFKISNFKGIQDLTLDLKSDAPGSITTLIGLNESGKTTILEALSHFISEDLATSTLVNTVHAKTNIQGLIPRNEIAAFSGNVSIKATVLFDEDDVDQLAEQFRKNHDLILDKSTFNKLQTFERRYAFSDSTYTDYKTIYSSKFSLKTTKQRSFKTYGSKATERDTWLKGTVILDQMLPQILYFPTFLFSFPDRIYLKDSPTAGANNAYYRSLLQSILDKQGKGLSLQKHVVERLTRDDGRILPSGSVPTQNKLQIDGVMQTLSSEMSRIIFDSWKSVLGREVKNKRIITDWHSDDDGEIYISLEILDGQSKFSIVEKSLGFRWFFSFLLFTHFQRASSGSGCIFLFDEPASHLHPKAQMKLLENFKSLAENGNAIIYSTHSHYLINPLWLERAYIIENKAIDYETDEDFDSFDVPDTDIRATKYRKFVAENPTKTTYFQPVLDALDASISPLLAASKALIVEGKYDFHPLHFFLDGKASCKIYPANGAGSVSNLVSLFSGWSVDFRVLFDGDKAGHTGRDRCRREDLVSATCALCLDDVAPALSGKSFEAFYGDDVKSAVAAHFGLSSPGKRDFAGFFQHLIASGLKPVFPETEANIQPLVDWLHNQFPLEK